MQFVCVQAHCRKPYILTAQQAKNIAGLCPECRDAARRKRGDLLDPVLYAECQKVMAAERKMLPLAGNIRQTRENLARWERRALLSLEEKPLRMNPVVGEALLGGPSPKAKSGKLGGPSGREG